MNEQSRIRIFADADAAFASCDYIDPSWAQFLPQDNPASFQSADITGAEIFAVPVDDDARLPKVSRAVLLIHKDDMCLLNSLADRSIYEWLLHFVRDERATFIFYVQGVYKPLDEEQRVVTRYYTATIAGIPAWMLGHLGDFEGADPFLSFNVTGFDAEGWVADYDESPLAGGNLTPRTSDAPDTIFVEEGP